MSLANNVKIADYVPVMDYESDNYGISKELRRICNEDYKLGN